MKNTASSGRFRDWAARQGLAGFLFLLLVLIATIYLSSNLVSYDASSVFTPCIEVTFGKEHWGKPGCKGISRIGQKSAEIAFNQLGIRDRDYPQFAAKGSFRILLLGSSNTLGPGIQESATIPRQLERVLLDKGRKVEVINGGMVGYCPSQMSLRTRELLLAYRPHLVLVQFVQGACPLFDGAWASSVYSEGKKSVFLDRSPIRKSERFAFFNSFLYQHPSLFFLWLSLKDQMLKIRFSQRYSIYNEPSVRLKSYLRQSSRFLREMQEEAKGQGAEFAIFSYKMRPFMQSIPAQMHPWIAKLASPFITSPGASGDQMMDALRSESFSVFYDGSPTEPFLIPGETHLNEEGLLRMADFLAKNILHLLPSRQH